MLGKQVIQACKWYTYLHCCLLENCLFSVGYIYLEDDNYISEPVSRDLIIRYFQLENVHVGCLTFAYYIPDSTAAVSMQRRLIFFSHAPIYSYTHVLCMCKYCIDYCAVYSAAIHLSKWAVVRVLKPSNLWRFHCTFRQRQWMMKDSRKKSQSFSATVR